MRWTACTRWNIYEPYVCHIAVVALAYISLIHLGGLILMFTFIIEELPPCSGGTSLACQIRIGASIFSPLHHPRAWYKRAFHGCGRTPGFQKDGKCVPCKSTDRTGDMPRKTYLCFVRRGTRALDIAAADLSAPHTSLHARTPRTASQQ